MRVRALLLLLCAAFALSGCGGGNEESASSEASNQAAAKEGGSSTPESIPDSRAEGSENPKPSASPNPPIATERTPGSKAVAPDVPVTKGGDNSIQAFGLEGENGEAAQAAAQLRAYLSAKVAGNWAAACAATSAQYREQLARMVAPTPDDKEPKGCPETLELLFGKAPKKALEETAQLNRVLSFRVQADGYAYLIYEAGEAVKFIAMKEEGGAWKVNTLEPAGFPEANEQGSIQ